MTIPHHRHFHRSGTLLILISGLSALLLSVTMAFLARMRSDAEEASVVVREAQARIMLMAGCTYICEASRLGYDDLTNTSAHEREARGWIDVRDGSRGPKILQGASSPQNIDIGSFARCPMYVMERPPFAIQLKVCYNPMDNRVIDTAGNPFNAATFGQPLLLNPDPQPVTDNQWNGAGTANDSNWNDYIHGDRTPRQNSVGMSWFRVFRDGPATFIITCGAGATQGFRDWNEVKASACESLFGGDSQYFTNLLAQEIRTWYRVEWSAAVPSNNWNRYEEQWDDFNCQDYFLQPVNSSHRWGGTRVFDFGGNGWGSWGMMHQKDMIGTIKWVQRLVDQPTKW